MNRNHGITSRLAPLGALVAALACLAAASPSLAQGNFKLGPVEVHPFLGIEERHDDNIYLTTGSETASGITQAGVGTNFVLKIKDRHALNLGYKADLLSYANDSDNNNAVHQTVDFGLACKSPSGWTLNASDKFQDTTDQASSELTQRARRVQNDADVRLTYKSETGLGGAVDVQHTVHNYLRPALEVQLDRSESRAGVEFLYPVASKTRALVGYQYTVINYDKDASGKDSTGHEASLGVQGDLLAKVTGLVKAGYTMRDYDDTVVGVKNDFQTASALVQVDWRPTERTQVTVAGTRNLAEATFATNRFYEATTGSIQVTQKIFNKWSAGVRASYENDRYPEATTIRAKTAKRADGIVQGGLNLDYDVQEWLKAGAFFQHRSRTSNFSDNFDYSNNIVGLNVKLAF